MKVLFVTTSYPVDHDDPRGIHVHRLARSLVRQGLTIRVVAPGSRNRELAEMDGVAVHRRRYWRKNGQRLADGLGGIIPNIRSRPWLAAQAPPLIASLYRGIRAHAEWADLVHAHWLYPAGILAAFAAPQQPLVVTSHGGDVNRVGTRGPARWAVSRVLAQAQLVLAVSDAIATRLEELGGDRKRIRFQPLGVDLNDDSPESAGWPTHPGQLKVAFVGSLIQRKDPLTLVEAARDLQDRGIGVSLAFCGDGPLRERVAQRCSSLGIAGTFPGNVAPNQVRSWLTAADLFVLPSRSEGRPVALMEAMAAGRPVVASDIEGIRELVTPEAGALAAPGDVSGFADAMLGFSQADKRRTTGEAGRRRIVELGLTTERVARNHIAIYEDLAAQGAT